MLPPKLIVIVDDEGRASLPKEVCRGSLDIIDSRDVAALAGIDNGAVLIDVDLRDIGQVKRIKDNLPTSKDGQIRIVVVEPGSHWCAIQANGLSASDLLKRPWDIDDLRKSLRRYGSRWVEGKSPVEDRLEAKPGGASILSAASELDRLFTAFTTNGALNFASVEQAGDQVVQAVSEVGLAKWLDTVRSYHKGTFQHCLLVTGVATTFGHKTGMRNKDILTLTVAGLLHDIGKAEVPTEILDKPGKLTNDEFAQVKKHPVTGYEYLRKQNVVDADTLFAVRHHHEYLDGTGYPDGLESGQIGDLTRIMTVCDVYGALVEQRSYKPPRSPDVAVEILTSMARDEKVEGALVKALANCVAA
jgi:putative nucleotidyltransferase with HDIG domain